MKTLKSCKTPTLLAVCLTCLLVAGCDRELSQRAGKTSRIDPSAYRCDDSQMALVDREVEICKQTGYLNSYCFAQAKKSQCELIAEAPKTDS